MLADEFIKKGFTKEELKKRINTVLKTKDQSESLERVSKRYLTKTRISPGKQAIQKKQKLLPKHPILIIDDDTDLLQSYILSLGEHGINNLIIENDSRKVGAILTKNTDISLCILDLHMPHLSGIELMQLIIEEFPDIPVIITTGVKSIETAIYCIKIG